MALYGTAPVVAIDLGIAIADWYTVPVGPRCISVLLALLCGFPALSYAQIPSEEAPPQVDCDTHAPNEERSNPQQLAMRGIACFEAQKFTKALRYYRQAYRVEQSPLLTAAIGRAFQELGYPALAKPYFVAFLNDQRSDPDARVKIRTRFENVETALKNSRELDFQSYPPGATIYLVVEGEHWEEIGTTPVSLALLSGDYEVVVQQEGYVTQTRSVSVRDEPVAESFDLLRADATYNVTSRTWRRRGVAMMLIATPIVAGGATLFALGVMRTNDAEAARNPIVHDNLIMDGVSLKQWGIIAGAVGVTALTTGIVFFVSGARKKPKTDESAIWFSGNGVGYAGEF